MKYQNWISYVRCCKSRVRVSQERDWPYIALSSYMQATFLFFANVLKPYEMVTGRFARNKTRVARRKLLMLVYYQYVSGLQILIALA